VPRLIELQKKYVEQLLTHKNPYTGKTYGEDPSVVMQEIVNEDSLFYRGNGDDFSIKPGRYARLWNQIWNAWLVSSFGDAAALAKRWAPATDEAGKKGLLSGEDPKAGTVASISTGPTARASSTRASAYSTATATTTRWCCATSAT
jgi:hypothetical protein